VSIANDLSSFELVHRFFLNAVVFLVTVVTVRVIVVVVTLFMTVVPFDVIPSVAFWFPDDIRFIMLLPILVSDIGRTPFPALKSNEILNPVTGYNDC